MSGDDHTGTGELDECGAEDDGYVCTIAPDHASAHIAEDWNGDIVHSWTTSDPT